jgi:hypothetical protein
MKDVIGVFNPFGLVQKAGRRKTHKIKTKTKTRKPKKSMRKKTRKNLGLFNFI